MKKAKKRSILIIIGSRN